MVPTGVFEAVSALRGAPRADGSQCRFPEGDPRAPDFHFCDNTAMIGSPYCQHHSNITFQPKG